MRQPIPIDDLYELELDLERAAIRRLDSGMELFEVASHLRRFITTDTYLPVELIGEIAEREGYGDAGIVCSSESGETKFGGKLYSVTSTRAGGRTVHVGDNLAGDQAQALVRGLRGRAWQPRHVRNRHMLGLGDIEAGNPVLSRLIATALRTDLREDILARYGLALGASLLAFALWIVHRAQELGVSDLYFAARDGWIVRQAAQRIIDAADLDIRCRYFSISRESLYPALISAAPTVALDRYLHTWESMTVAESLKRLNLTSASSARMQRIARISPDDLIYEQEVQDAVRRSLLGNWSQVEKANRERSDLILAYLEQEEVLSDQPMAMIDLGWHGSLQQVIGILRQKRRSGDALTGLYFGHFETPAHTEFFELDCRGFLCTDGVPSERTERLLLSPSLIELLHSAPHGSTKAYERVSSGAVQPVYREDNSASLYRSLIEPLHREVLALIDASLADSSKNQLSAAPNPEIVSRILASIISSPTEEERRIFGSGEFASDFGVEGRPLNSRGEDLALWQAGVEEGPNGGQEDP